MRKIAIVTVSRSDYGLLYPIIKRIASDRHAGLSLQLIVTGMHLSPEFGNTVKVIESDSSKDGFDICEKVEMLLSSDTPTGVAKSMGLGTIGFAQVYEKIKPDLLLVSGDRFETHCAVVAAMPFGIPVAHIHGGESTEGSMDELIRHSITKMSHIHFPSTAFYAERIKRMGEENWRVVVSGAPGLDNIKMLKPLMSKGEFKEEFALDLELPTIIVTYHPVTLEYKNTSWQMQNLLAALEAGAIADQQIVFTYPNADTMGRTVIKMINDFIQKAQRELRPPMAGIYMNLGQRAYLSLMKYASAMVGNSSSGIIEAPSFELPVVNIGNRQRGRVRARNVIDVGYSKDEILDGIEKALSQEFKYSLRGLVNPYGEGNASQIIADVLKNIDINDNLILKRFNDAKTGNEGSAGASPSQKPQ